MLKECELTDLLFSLFSPVRSGQVLRPTKLHLCTIPPSEVGGGHMNAIAQVGIAVQEDLWIKAIIPAMIMLSALISAF